MVDQEVGHRKGSHAGIWIIFLWVALLCAPGIANAITASDCTSCHGTNVVAGHHQTPEYTSGQCTVCHVGVTTTGDCAGCHTFVPQSNKHHDTAAAQQGDCAKCHSNVGTLGDCASCHQGKLRAPHHTAAGQQNIDCQSCHTTMSAGAGCQGCHGSDTRTAHHAAADTNNLACASCHVDIQPVTGCDSCHSDWGVDANGNALAASDRHHAAAATSGKLCTDCHSGAKVGVEPLDCHTCHQGQAAEAHHAMLSAGLDCNICHTQIELNLTKVSTTCQTCHAPGQENQDTHHALAMSNPDTQCQTCHTDAAPVPDCATCHTTWTAGSARDQHHTAAAGAACATCHTGGFPGQGGNCQACHSGEASTVHHAMIGTKSCQDCHTTMAPIAGCASCHDGSSQQTHHETVRNSDPVAYAECGSCHTGIAPSSNCTDCHTPSSWATTAADAHHAVADASNLSCNDCHSGITPVGGCNDCHSFATTNIHHDAGVGNSYGVGCLDCHTMGIVNGVYKISVPTPAQCETCHTGGYSTAVGQVFPVQTIPVVHHNTTKVDPANCGGCHQGIDTVSGGLDCAGCHASQAKKGDAAMHHATANYGNSNCQACHAGVSAAQLDCAACHNGTVAPAGNSQTHHNTTKVDPTNCAGCHGAVGAMDCSACHDGSVAPAGNSVTHHATTKVDNQVCSNCHSIDQAELDCAACHATKAKDGKAAMHHATGTATSGTCTDCHSSIDVTQLACADCHATQPVKNGSAEMHHMTQAAIDNNCAVTCHKGAASADMDCAGCHIAPNAVPMNERHHFAADRDGIACSSCHTGVNAAGLDCATCHTAAGQPPIVDQHHMTIPYQMGECATCHVGVSTAGLDCAACHDGSVAVPGTSATHHATTAYNLGSCDVCHQGAEIAGISCGSCHGAGGLYQAPNHHGQPAYAAGTCDVCHTTITLNGGGCADCHNTVPIPELHHGTPLTNVNGDCGVCHQSVSSPDQCANCHQASPHHTTTWAAAGDCAHCHSWPADKDENPQQASCRQCHSSKHSDKGGPVQDYRICFDCHGTGGNANFPLAKGVLPFHARPAQGVGLTNPAPGKGSFNLQYSIIGGKSRSNYTDRFGDQEQWENLDEGRQYQNPAIEYTLVTISEGGKTYQVPAFADLPGGGGSTPPPTTDPLAVCTSCHSDLSYQVSCSNSKWTDHLSRGRVTLAVYQLAETTYIGSLCDGSGSTPPPAADVNLALNKSARASSDEGSSYSASKGVDGNTGSYWWKDSSRDHWLWVDLGSRQSISKVVIQWGGEYATDYRVEVSNDASSWSQVFSDRSGSGGTETVTFSSREARYVRVYCREDRRNGYQIKELEVYK